MKKKDKKLSKIVDQNVGKYKRRSVKFSDKVNVGLTKIKPQQLPELIKKADRYSNCCNVITGLYFKDKKTKDNHIHIDKIWQCGLRLCPNCEKIMARKKATQISAVLSELQNEALLFLTLTVPNVQHHELPQTLDRMNQAYEALMAKQIKKRKLKRIILGYYRKLEITEEKKRDNYLHPHYHCLLHVQKSYFASKSYIKRDDWLKMWQDCYGDKSITQVDVRRVDSMKQPAQELGKYTAKVPTEISSKDTIKFIQSIVIDIKGKRFFTCGGTIRKLLKEGKITKEDLEKQQELIAKFAGTFDHSKLKYSVEKTD